MKPDSHLAGERKPMTNEREAPVDEVIAEVSNNLKFYEDLQVRDGRGWEGRLIYFRTVLAALKEMQASRQGEAVAWRLKIDGEWLVDDSYEWVMQKGADNAGAIESEIEPLYTRPPSQPVELSDAYELLTKDAARYQYWRARVFEIDRSDEGLIRIAASSDVGPCGDFLDEETDAAIAAQEPK